MKWTWVWLNCVVAAYWSLAAFGDLPKSLTISAANVDRTDTIVSFALPADAPQGDVVLRDDSGKTTTILCTSGRQAWLVLDSLPAGTSRTYKIDPSAPRSNDHPAVAIEKAKTGGAIKASAFDGSQSHEILTYQSEKTPLPPGYDPAYQRGGYISPVYTPTGKLLTDDYPDNHKHHHGIWFPWTKTEFEGRHPDFWNMATKTGRVEPDDQAPQFSAGGSVCGTIRGFHRFIDMTAKAAEKVALREQWDIVVYRQLGPAGKPYFVFDLTSTQNALDVPLLLPKYYYGGLGYRGRAEWNGKGDVVTMLSSEGKTRANGNETRGKWMWVGGKAEGGATIGLAIFCHPDNFRAPQPIRFNPEMPFVCYAPSQLGDWKIEPGTPYVSRYRFIAADGAADVKEIERLWADYAQPPKVTVN
jgi:hypothetical protein